MSRSPTCGGCMWCHVIARNPTCFYMPPAARISEARYLRPAVKLDDPPCHVYKAGKPQDSPTLPGVDVSQEHADGFADSFPGRALANFWMCSLGYDADKRRKSMTRWLTALDLLVRRDGRSWADLDRLVRWMVEDRGDGRGKGQWAGWRDNCRAPSKLRTKRRNDDRTYFEYIWEQMERQAGRRGACSTKPEDWEAD